MTRTRLHERLDAAAASTTTVLVTGPAGSGKTVLVSAWAAERDAGWLTLGPEHADPGRLLADVAAAAAAVGVRVDAIARGGGHVPERVKLHGRSGSRPALVLDEVQTLRGAAVETLGAVVRGAGVELGLVLASRSDPDIGLGRLRLEGRMSDIRAGELAFTTAETAALLAAHGLSLTGEQIDRLCTRTQGWAAGLRLAALTLQEGGDTEAFLQDFAGDDHAVADYLGREVLALQRPDLRGFLLRTSIPDELCGELADELTGRGDGARTLLELERAGVFLQALDRHGRAFRYHPLFAELLRARLAVELPDEERELQARTARWLAAHGRGAEALSHAIRAGEPTGMADLLAERWLDLLLAAAPPDAVLQAASLRPDDRRLALASGAALLAAGDAERARTLLGPLSAVADEHGALARLLLARSDGDPAAARDAARDGLRRRLRGGSDALAVDDLRRGITLLHLGVTELEAGDPEAAEAALDAALALTTGRGRPRMLLECLGRRAALEVLAGRLDRAEAAAETATGVALSHGWQRTAGAAWAWAALGAVRWLRGDACGAEAAADAAATAAYAAADDRAADAVRLLRGHVAAERGDRERARALQRPVVDGFDGVDAVLARWAEALGPSPWLEADDPLAAGMTKLSGGHALSALRCAEAVLAAPGPRHPTRALHAWLVVAVAHHALGQSRLGAEAIERALEVAAPERYRQPFRNGGSAVNRLLHRHAEMPTAYGPLLADLVDVLEPGVAEPGLVEPLSDRERDVLRLLPSLLANTEIAGELFVSVNTVKTHVKSIYRKLEVGSRREAVARARQLRLL